MLRSLSMLLPALIPSWRFFDTVAPSPRIEFTILENGNETQSWEEFRPRPEAVSVVTMLGRMFWNPHWNEQLFLVSCSERLMNNPTRHSIDEISDRIRHDLAQQGLTGDEQHFQFRLVFVAREGAEIERQITYLSPLFEASIMQRADK